MRSCRRPCRSEHGSGVHRMPSVTTRSAPCGTSCDHSVITEALQPHQPQDVPKLAVDLSVGHLPHPPLGVGGRAPLDGVEVAEVAGHPLERAASALAAGHSPRSRSSTAGSSSWAQRTSSAALYLSSAAVQRPNASIHSSVQPSAARTSIVRRISLASCQADFSARMAAARSSVTAGGVPTAPQGPTAHAGSRTAERPSRPLSRWRRSPGRSPRRSGRPDGGA